MTTKTLIRLGLWTLAVIVAVVLAYPHAPTTFDVTAEVESVTFMPQAGRSLEWRLERARLRNGVTDTGAIVSGTLAMSNSVQVRIERQSQGPLRIELEPRKGIAMHEASLGTFTPDSAQPIPLRITASFEISDLEARSDEGRPVVLFVEGSLIAGATANESVDASQPLLRTGTVTMIGTSLFSSTRFPAGMAELRAGDRLEVEEPLSASVGFVSADERPALTVGFRVIASSATVVRPGGASPRIATSRQATLLGDPVLRSALAVVLLLGPLLIDLASTIKRVRRRVRHRGRKTAVVPASLLLICLWPAASPAQSVALRGAEEGQGLTRPRGAADCFIVAPLHVVGQSTEVRVTGEGRETTSAEPKETWRSADIAILEFVPSPAFPCPEWNVPANLDDLLGGGTISAVLRERDEYGGITFTPVTIISFTREVIRVEPRKAEDRITSGMSGSQLMVNGRLAGMLQSVDGRTGVVMRSDNLVRILGSFFTGRMSPVVSDAVNLTLTRGESTVVGDQHTVFGYYAGNGPLGVRIRLNGESHDMGPGTRLPFPDSRRNCVIILIRFEEVQGIARGGEKADFRIACTPR